MSMSYQKTASYVFIIFIMFSGAVKVSAASDQVRSSSSKLSLECSSPVLSQARPALPASFPWKNAKQLCKDVKKGKAGKPWSGAAIPNNWQTGAQNYGEATQAFLRSLDYRKPIADGGLGWIGDARWRLTGDWAGCPTSNHKWTNEVHPAVRIYYSPEVMKWLCENRFPGREVANPPALPTGAMIIKEMHNATDLAYRPDSGGQVTIGEMPPATSKGKLWVTEDYGDPQYANSLQWTIMTKGAESYDGWYWAYFAAKSKTQAACSTLNEYNPPVQTVSALATASDEKGYPLQVDECGQPLASSKQIKPPLGPWYPTFTAIHGTSMTAQNIVFPNAEFGNYCIYCHGSANSQSTFSSLTNILGDEIEYDYLTQIPSQSAPTASLAVDSDKLDLTTTSGSIQKTTDRIIDDVDARLTKKSSSHILKGIDKNTPRPITTGINAGVNEHDFDALAQLTHKKYQNIRQQKPLLKSSSSQPNPRFPFPAYNPKNLTQFEEVFPQFSGLTFDDVWPNRLPAQTWDHHVSASDGPDQFITSDQCLSCHDAGGSGQRLPNMVVVKDNNEQINLSEHAEWAASPMGLAGRDPIFYAMLESELNRAVQESPSSTSSDASSNSLSSSSSSSSSLPTLADLAPCLQNTCLHCHGNMGQRQHAIDTAGQEPENDLCKAFEPLTDPTVTKGAQKGTWTDAERKAAGYGGKPFLLKDMAAWSGSADPHNAQYGGLGRDGISCATCHHIADEDLGNSGKTFTGNFRVGPANELYGPFDDVLTKPMQNSLGITPRKGSAITKSSMCGSCHAIYLPQFNNQGQFVESDFEQTTYLEWANSAFNDENYNAPADDWKSCQDCHMSNNFVYTDGTTERQISLERTRIANIQDSTFPKADHEQTDLTLKHRDYKRHTLFGLNVFLNAFFQQYPMLLGARQQNYMNYSTTAPLLTAREEVLLIARRATANVTVDNVSVSVSSSATNNMTLSADVTIENLTGHKLPSGVGFRRAFVEFSVFDTAGTLVWTSGRTSDVGIIQNGLQNEALPSELLEAPSNPATSPCKENYQPHYQVITDPCQVQIYEELVQDSDGVFTTSFIHRITHVKDNRLLPKGYRVLATGDTQPDYCKPWCMESNPIGKATNDPEYQSTTAKGVTGSDIVTYQISLPAQTQVGKVTATLYSQATAPYFLEQRFSQAKKMQSAKDQVNAKRLYFMMSHLNTDAKANDGTAYLDDYKLLINSDTKIVNSVP